MSIQKRSVLIVALLISQITCVVLGVIWFGSWAKKEITNQRVKQIIDDNQLFAEQMARLINEMQLDDLSINSPQWKRLQTVIEQIRLPNDGFICLTEAGSGKLICHPKVSMNPDILNLKPGMAKIESKDASRSIVASVESNGSVGGSALLPDGVHLVAARRLPELNANVMVHQLHSAIKGHALSQTATLVPVGLVVGCFVVALTGIACFSISNSYESRLRENVVQLEDMVEQKSRSLVKTRNAVIFGLAKLAESRDTDTGDHLDRIRHYSTMLAAKLRERDPSIDEDFVKNIGLASALHDIGKVGIPDHVLLKPGKLDAEERTIIETHPQIGGECLSAIMKRLGEDDFLSLAQEIAYFHHEKWDGSGYPFGLPDNKIPLAARIVAVADVYDALRSKRPYKSEMQHDKACQIIMESSGSHFDPRVVAAFEALQVQFREISSFAEQVAENTEPETDSFQFSEIHASFSCVPSKQLIS